jgi:hypothetical protein
MSDQNSNEENIAVLREQAQASEMNRLKAEATARENAMLKAHVDISTPIGQMFLSAYQGELTTEAIQAQAAEVGAWKAPAETPPPATTPTPQTPGQPQSQTYDATEAALRMLAQQGTAGTAGGTETPPPPADPIKESYDEFSALVARGRTREDAAIAVIGAKMKLAAEGNPAVLYDPERDKEGTRQDLRVPQQWMGL